MYNYDVYLCVDKLKNSQGFTCVKYASFEQAEMMYKHLGISKSNPYAILAIPKVIPNYFVKPVLEYKLQGVVGKVVDMWPSR